MKADEQPVRRSSGFLQIGEDAKGIDRTGMTKRQQRDAEQRLLRPAALAAYDGEIPEGIDPLAKQRVMVIFQSPKDLILFSRHFRVNKYGCLNVTGKNAQMFLDFLKALESGSLCYDKTARRFSAPRRQRNS